MSENQIITLATTEETATEQSRNAIIGGYSDSGSSSAIKLSKAEMNDLREAFRLFDTENRGIISLGEIREVVDSLALENNNENSLASNSYRQLSDILNSAAADEDLQLDEESFIAMMSERPENDTRDEYQRVFDLFDHKKKGYINIHDLRKVSEELGESMTDEELDEMISKAAPTSGKVTLEDFERIMTKRLFS